MASWTQSGIKYLAAPGVLRSGLEIYSETIHFGRFCPQGIHSDVGFVFPIQYNIYVLYVPISLFLSTE